MQYFVLMGVVFCHTNSSKKGCAVFCCNGCSIMSYESRLKSVVQYFVLTGVVFCHTNSSKKGCAVFCCNGCSIMSYELE